MPKDHDQSFARTRLLAAGFTTQQAQVIADVIWYHDEAGDEPASARYLENVAGRVLRSLVVWQGLIAGAVVLAVKFLH